MTAGERSHAAAGSAPETAEHGRRAGRREEGGRRTVREHHDPRLTMLDDGAPGRKSTSASAAKGSAVSTVTWMDGPRRMRCDDENDGIAPMASASAERGSGARAGRAAHVRVAMRGQGNEQRAAAAGDEQDVDAAGEDGTNMGQRVLVVDGAIAGRQEQARGSIGDQQREPVARTEDRDLWRGEVRSQKVKAATDPAAATRKTRAAVVTISCQPRSLHAPNRSRLASGQERR